MKVSLSLDLQVTIEFEFHTQGVKYSLTAQVAQKGADVGVQVKQLEWQV